MEVFIVREDRRQFGFRTPQGVYEKMKDECILNREVQWVLLLDTKNNVIRKCPVSIGTLDSSIVHPREVFKTAILCDAKHVLLVHNHPSGNPKPSNEDIASYYKIRKCGKILGIGLLDSIIIARDGYVSLAEMEIAGTITEGEFDEKPRHNSIVR